MYPLWPEKNLFLFLYALNNFCLLIDMHGLLIFKIIIITMDRFNSSAYFRFIVFFHIEGAAPLLHSLK